MRRLLACLGLVTLLLGACGYSEEFRADFLDACYDTSGREVAYCWCALEHLEENGPSDEEDITVQDQREAIEACEGLVSGKQEGAGQTSNY